MLAFRVTCCGTLPADLHTSAFLRAISGRPKEADSRQVAGFRRPGGGVKAIGAEWNALTQHIRKCARFNRRLVFEGIWTFHVMPKFVIPFLRLDAGHWPGWWWKLELPFKTVDVDKSPGQDQNRGTKKRHWSRNCSVLFSRISV